MLDPTPTYELTLDRRPGYLYARVKADVLTEETALGYLVAVADSCRKLNYDRLVVHRDIPATLPSGAFFAVATDVVDKLRGIRVAFVNPYPHLDEDLRFGVMVGNNRGAKYAVFSNHEEAERWVLT